jgi:GWxTD domain-containing protein
LVSAVLGAANVRAATPSWEEPKASWRNGPVRELLTADEDKAFKAAKTDEDRAKAIADFWARRDPSPGTPDNEFHAEFVKRVEFADAEFGEGTGPGWTTDRGRLFLLAGAPAGPQVRHVGRGGAGHLDVLPARGTLPSSRTISPHWRRSPSSSRNRAR